LSDIVTRGNVLGVLNEVCDIMLAKNADYGDAWKTHGYIGLLVRLGDKLARIETINGRRALVADETIRDTLVDAIGYATLAILALEYANE
jgi:hypothetical protein